MKFIDAIHVEPSGLSARGTLVVDPAADYLKDHFPGAPTLPGLVMLEAAVRTAAALWAGRPAGGPWAMLEHVDQLILLRRVVPGETLVVRVELMDDSQGAQASFKAEGAVGGETAMRARFRIGTGTVTPNLGGER